MKKIVLTGGGTAGHVTANIALIPYLKKAGYEISYFGSYTGIEKTLIEPLDVTYYGISTGKLRRYFSLDNFKDPFKVMKGYFEAKKYLKSIRPDIIFSKGGFVTVPVIKAAASLKIPCILHESDMTPGLANKLCIPSAKKVCCTFPETLNFLPKNKAVFTGAPIRDELFNGSIENALAFCHFDNNKKILLVMGGSLGAKAINDAIRGILDLLLEDFNIIHLCGKGKLEKSLLNKGGYQQFEYVNNEMKDFLTCADLIISRAGSNSICEFLALKKLNLLIPLSANASRGDQILNAKSFEKSGYSKVLLEEDVTSESLLAAIKELLQSGEEYMNAMNSSSQKNAIEMIMQLIKEVEK